MATCSAAHTAAAATSHAPDGDLGGRTAGFRTAGRPVGIGPEAAERDADRAASRAGRRSSWRRSSPTGTRRWRTAATSGRGRRRGRRRRTGGSVATAASRRSSGRRRRRASWRRARRTARRAAHRRPACRCATPATSPSARRRTSQSWLSLASPAITYTIPTWKRSDPDDEHRDRRPSARRQHGEEGERRA